MEKILKIIALAVVLVAVPCMGQGNADRHDNGSKECRHGGNDWKTCGHDDDRNEYRHHRHPKYHVGKSDVFFGGRKVKDASALSFKVLEGGYAKDAWSVFYCGNKINDASPNSFDVLEGGYAKDAWSVFYRGNKMKDASPNSFKVLKGGYAKDTWTVFYKGMTIDGANADSFHCGRDGYAGDRWNEYYRGRKMK